MKYKYIKLLLQLKINLRNPNIIDVGDDNSHTIYTSPNTHLPWSQILNLNGETTNWRLITYKYNNKLSYTYDYNVFGIFGNPVISSPIYDSIDDLMIGLENDYDRLYNRDEIVIIPKSRKDRIVKETKPFI